MSVGLNILQFTPHVVEVLEVCYRSVLMSSNWFTINDNGVLFQTKWNNTHRSLLRVITERIEERQFIAFFPMDITFELSINTVVCSRQIVITLWICNVISYESVASCPLITTRNANVRTCLWTFFRGKRKRTSR